MSIDQRVAIILNKYQDLKKKNPDTCLKDLVDLLVKEFDRFEMLFDVKDSIARITDVGFSNMLFDEYKWYYLNSK